MLPVTLGRVEKALREKDVNSKYHDTQLVTGFPNAAVVFEMKGEDLVISSMWRGKVPQDRAGELVRAVQEWNVMNLQPALHVASAGEEADLGTYSYRVLPSAPNAAGYTQAQLAVFVYSTLEGLFQCFSFIEERFQDLVTWPDDIARVTNAKEATDERD